MPPKWEKLGTMLPTTWQCGTTKTTPPSTLTLKTFAPEPLEPSQTIAAELTRHDTLMTVQTNFVAIMLAELIMTLFMSAAPMDKLSWWECVNSKENEKKNSKEEIWYQKWLFRKCDFQCVIFWQKMWFCDSMILKFISYDFEMYFMPALSEKGSRNPNTRWLFFYDPNDVFWAMFHVDVFKLTIIYICSVWVSTKLFYTVMYRKVPK